MIDSNCHYVIIVLVKETCIQVFGQKISAVIIIEGSTGICNKSLNERQNIRSYIYTK